jgi:hypothetical protein
MREHEVERYDDGKKQREFQRVKRHTQSACEIGQNLASHDGMGASGVQGVIAKAIFKLTIGAVSRFDENHTMFTGNSTGTHTNKHGNALNKILCKHLCHKYAAFDTVKQYKIECCIITRHSSFLFSPTK